MEGELKSLKQFKLINIPTTKFNAIQTMINILKMNLFSVTNGFLCRYGTVLFLSFIFVKN